jgi:hypothetical protein
VAGYEKNTTGHNVAKYWKNGTEVDLNSNSQDAFANSIFVSGSDVYVAGRMLIGNHYAAVEWKDGILNLLSFIGSPQEDQDAKSIFVSDGVDYVAGFDGNVAKYWVKGYATALTDGSPSAQATSIYVSGNDVYVAGYEGYVVKYWKNGEVVNLTDGYDFAWSTSIYVNGSDVYTAGFKNSNNQYNAMYWKNSTEVPLSGFSPTVLAESIFVK